MKSFGYLHDLLRSTDFQKLYVNIIIRIKIASTYLHELPTSITLLQRY